MPPLPEASPAPADPQERSKTAHSCLTPPRQPLLLPFKSCEQRQFRSIHLDISCKIASSAEITWQHLFPDSPQLVLSHSYRPETDPPPPCRGSSPLLCLPHCLFLASACDTVWMQELLCPWITSAQTTGACSSAQRRGASPRPGSLGTGGSSRQGGSPAGGSTNPGYSWQLCKQCPNTYLDWTCPQVSLSSYLALCPCFSVLKKVKILSNKS